MLALVDLDGTLIDRDSGFACWAQAFVTDNGLDATDVVWLAETDRAVKERGAFFTLVEQRFPAAGDAAALWADYRQRMPVLTSAFPGVHHELEVLREHGWRLGVVTNGRVDNQMGKLRRAGLLDLLDGWCISEEVGVRRPDPVIFVFARERCGAPPEAPCWVVGDDPEADVAAGAAAGAWTVWVSHGRQWPLAGPTPDRVAQTPAGALAALRSS